MEKNRETFPRIPDEPSIGQQTAKLSTFETFVPYGMMYTNNTISNVHSCMDDSDNLQSQHNYDVIPKIDCTLTYHRSASDLIYVHPN